MRRLLIAALLLSAAPVAGSGQEVPSVALGVDVGPAIPLGDFNDDGAELGLSVAAHATLRLNRLFGVYASVERTSFGVEETAAFERDDSWTDSGLGVGGKIWIPVDEDARLHPWATLGLSWHDVDAPIAGPEFAGVDTEGIRSLDASAGFDLLVAGRTFFLRPTARYRKYSFEVDTPEFSGESSISYLALALGVLVVLPIDL